MTAGARTARTRTLAIKRNGCGRISDVSQKASSNTCLEKSEKGCASQKAWPDKNRTKLRERENRRRQANREESKPRPGCARNITDH